MSEVVEFLENGGLGEPVERVDTHGAQVFVGAATAWKMKRPVQFRFLDFSTLEKRERVLRRELELNRRTAPSIYRDVVPVTQASEGRLQVGGSGRPVEWLLEMARFKRSAQLDRMADDGQLTPEVVERLARRVAGFHEQAEIVRDGGGYDGLAEVVAGNTADLLDLCPAVLQREQVEELDERSRDLLARHRQLLDQRRDGGRVRHCHGDLHLGNVVMLDDQPTPFDCLEFDDALACVDVVYDLAFLIMDLLQRRLTSHAQRTLQGWIEVAQDDAGVTLLPLCLATRAAVRAKVEGLQEDGEAARRYLTLARSFLNEGPPVLVAIGGVSGTGKTSLARGLAPMLGRVPGAVILRSDVIRKGLYDQEPEERLPADAYRPEVSERVFEVITERAKQLLFGGQAVIADAVYGEEWQRRSIEKVAAETNTRFVELWLEAPQDVLEQRVAARQSDASDADVDVLRQQVVDIDRSKVSWAPFDASGNQSATLSLAREAVRNGG